MSDTTTAFSGVSSTGSALSMPQTLRNLYLTLFLRGRSARGLQKDKPPKSIAQKLWGTLLLYGLFGCLALTLIGQPVFLLSAYLHAMTFIFLGMFIASSAGEVLFNREEAEILLHRPIPARYFLRAKIRVIVEVAFWLAVAFNFVGLFVGLGAADGDWRFPFVHLLSIGLMSLFCAGSVVLVYQLCLHWFGKEWLDGMMTTAQVIISVGAVMAGQLVPQLLFRVEKLNVTLSDSWWPLLFPPAWFAGVDDVLAGAPSMRSVVGALLAVTATGFVLWLSYSKLSEDYQTGLQRLSEVKSSSAKSSRGRRILHRLVDAPPFRWWLRDPVVRSSFLLTTAYLVRDRDVKLRVYPGLAPFLIFPAMMIAQGFRSDGRQDGGFLLALSCGYAGVVPMMALDLLKYSQNWQAADIFRAVPLLGPAPILCGARRAVLAFTLLPVIAILVTCMAIVQGDSSQWLLTIPALLPIPIFAILPHAVGKAIPLSQPTEESKAFGRGLVMMGAMFASIAVSGLAIVANSGGWLWGFVLVEAIVVAAVYLILRKRVNDLRWESLE